MAKEFSFSPVEEPAGFSFSPVEEGDSQGFSFSPVSPETVYSREGMSFEDIPEAQAQDIGNEEARFQRFKAKRITESAKPFTQKAKEFGTGALSVVEQAKKSIPEFLSSTAKLAANDPAKLARSMIEGGARGGVETGKLVSDLVNSVGDELFFDEEEEIRREFERQEADENFEKFFQAEGLVFDSDQTDKTVTAGASILLDPSNFIGAGAVSKVAKGTKLASKGAQSLKLQKLSNVLQKGAGVLEDVAKPMELPNRIVNNVLRPVAKVTAGGTGLGLKFVAAPVSKVIGTAAGIPRQAIGKIMGKGLGNLTFIGGSAVFNPVVT